VTIGNYLGCSCIYFVIMSASSLGGHGAWVQCKHMYYILQNIIYCGQAKKIIHYPMWSWDKLLRFNIHWHKIKHVKTNDMIITCCICINFLCISHLHYSKEYMYKNTINHARVSRKVQRIM